MRNKRELFWDIIKGIGIVSIVVGHVVGETIAYYFVYMYHLAIFYFISAYFYNEEKYGDNPSDNFKEKLKINWLKYIFYSIILILLHNTFVKYNFMSLNVGLYSNPIELISRILNALVFSCSELFAGAMWFLPTLIFALTIFGIIVYYSRKISNISQDEKIKKSIKYYFIIIFAIVNGMLGVFLSVKKIKLNYNIQTSFLVIPICAAGYFLRKNKRMIKKIKKIYISIPTFIVTIAIILYVIIQKGYQIELAAGQIINGYMFYIMSFIGILFCMSSAAIIERIPVINRLTALLGKHSFAIMALHFVAVKLVDVIYLKMINVTNPEIISKWVVSCPEKLWWAYIVIGCLLPLLFSIILEKLKSIKLVKI